MRKRLMVLQDIRSHSAARKVLRDVGSVSRDIQSGKCSYEKNRHISPYIFNFFATPQHILNLFPLAMATAASKTTTPELRVLTLREPMATLVIHGWNGNFKTIENRSRSLKCLLNQDVAIHVSRQLFQGNVASYRRWHHSLPPEERSLYPTAEVAETWRAQNVGRILGTVRFESIENSVHSLRTTDRPWAIKGNCFHVLTSPKVSRSQAVFSGSVSVWRIPRDYAVVSTTLSAFKEAGPQANRPSTIISTDQPQESGSHHRLPSTADRRAPHRPIVDVVDPFSEPYSPPRSLLLWEPLW